MNARTDNLAGDTPAAAREAPLRRPGELLLALTPEDVSEAIKAAGCAVSVVEHDGVARLHSASHGIGFQVLWGNALGPGRYADLTFSCPLRVQGGVLPEPVLADWHRSKRFARVALHGDFVVLEMDLVAAGGVAATHLSVMVQLWTQMMGQFFVHLRNFRPQVDAAAAAPQAAA